jgi:chromosome segregation ATPase
MSNPDMTPDALPQRVTAAPFRMALGLVLAAGAGAMLWGAVVTHDLSVASETPVAIEDRVAALMVELDLVKAGTAKLRDSQGRTSEELSHIRASLANAESGLAALRTTTNENEARRRDAAMQVESNLAQLKEATLRLRTAQDDSATEIGMLRASAVNSEVGLDGLRATAGEISRQIERIEAARDATGSIATIHRHHIHHIHKKWAAQR